VLGAFIDNFFSHQDEAPFVAARADAQRRHRAGAAFSLMLSREADAIAARLAGLPATIVKGPLFARSIYPKATLRCFSDIDVLVAPVALDQAGQVLSDRGFELRECSPIGDPQEWKWLHRKNRALMVELQTNLVHAGSLRRIMTLPYDALAPAPHSPASLLLVALIHGGGHHYQRLQHIVDICQAARNLEGTSEERRFERLVRKTNSQFVAVAGLKLAAKIFRERRCREIARAIGPVRFETISSLLLGPRLVMSTTSANRRRHSWRRSVFRWLMKNTPQLSEP
jgi:hypothetical protein